jgi:hypothetical protein
LGILVILDGQFARPILGGLAQAHTHSQHVFHLLDRRARIRIELGFGGLGSGGACAPSAASFQLPHGHSAAGRAVREAQPKLRVSYRKQRPAMPWRETPVFDEVEDLLFQTQKTRSVTDGGPVFAGFCSYFFLGQMKFAHQALVGARFFDWVEVLALDILDQSYLKRHLIGDFADDRRHTAEACSLRCSPAAFAGKKLIARSDSPQNQRLNNPAYPDRLGKFCQRLFPKMSARLITPGVGSTFGATGNLATSAG